MTSLRVYEDGGYSADSMDRPALKEMLRGLRDGKLNCVLTYKIDRLTRSVKVFHEDNGLQTRHNCDEGIAVFICEVTALASEESV